MASFKRMFIGSIAALSFPVVIVFAPISQGTIF